MSYKILLSCCLSFIIGIGAHQQWSVDIPTWLLGVLFTAFIFSKLTKIPKLSRVLNCLRLLILLSLALCLGSIRSAQTNHTPSPSTVDHYATEERQPQILTGSIVAEPDIRRDKINYTIEVNQLKDPKSEQWRKVNGKTLISAGKYPAYSYGDTLEITGHLQRPSTIEDFDYPGYLSRFGIYSVIYRPKITPTEAPPSRSSISVFHPKNYWPMFFRQLLKLKYSFEYQMNRTFSTEPSSSFMAGLLLGSRKGIPEELSEAFRITGLTHIIAISGYNITLIVSILMALFKPFGKKTSIILSAVGIILFTLFVGASPAVVRACIMGLISLLALHSKRKGNITLTLCITASIMVGYNPKILIHDVGFQLSFLATMGLIYVAPLLEPYFQWLPNRLAIRESILLTLSAQIMALPIILYNFNNLSIVSPLSNLLIAGPILPLAMLFGFLGTMTSYLSIALGKLIAFPAYLLLQYVTSITVLTSKIPYASVSIHWFQKELFVLYFLLLSFFLYSKWKRTTIIQQHIRQLTITFNQDLNYTAYAL